MPDLASEIRSNIASIESDMHKLRRSAKKTLEDPEKEQQIYAALRRQTTRLQELMWNLASVESAAKGTLERAGSRQPPLLLAPARFGLVEIWSESRSICLQCDLLTDVSR